LEQMYPDRLSKDSGTRHWNKWHPIYAHACMCTYVCVCRLDGWMDGWTDGRTDM